MTAVAVIDAQEEKRRKMQNPENKIMKKAPIFPRSS